MTSDASAFELNGVSFSYPEGTVALSDVSLAIALGEDHNLIREGPTEDVLSDREFLIRTNLIHGNPDRRRSMFTRKVALLTSGMGGGSGG